MGIVKRFKKYATAFEVTLLDGDWSRIEPFFAEDAVYEGNPTAKGRDAVIAKLKNGVESLDRLMDGRIPMFKEPTVVGDTLTMRWTVTYSKAGLPDLEISGVETAIFEGDSIKLLRDTLDAEAQAAMLHWMDQHGSTLKGE